MYLYIGKEDYRERLYASLLEYGYVPTPTEFNDLVDCSMDVFNSIIDEMSEMYFDEDDFDDEDDFY